MKLWITLSGFLILYFTYGFYISTYDVSAVPDMLKKENPTGFYDYKGVINVHTDLSIGSSSPAKVIAAAKAVGLDFLLLTDLNNFDVIPSVDTHDDGTLILLGGKYSYLDSRLIHYSPKEARLGDSLGEAQTRLADFLSQDIAGHADHLVILAHPFKAGFSWSGDIPAGLDGFEILNTKSMSNRAWETSRVSTIWSLVTYPFNPKLSFIRLYTEPTEELDLFDKLSQERFIIGFAGAEASARAIPLANYLIKFPSYQRSFEFVTNHVLLRSELTGNPESDRQKIFTALKQGNFYLSFDLIGDPRGFFAAIEDKGRLHVMGAKLKLSKGMKLVAHLPSTPQSFYEVVVYRNGERYETFNAPSVELPITEPGVYRLQVRVSPYLPLPDAKKWITWIYTNPFFIQP